MIEVQATMKGNEEKARKKSKKIISLQRAERQEKRNRQEKGKSTRGKGIPKLERVPV